MRSTVSSLALVAILSTTRSSHAQAAPGPELERSWYGWQIAIAAGTSYAIALLATQSKDTSLLLVALAGAYVGGPVVHAAHRGGTHALAFRTPVLNRAVPAAAGGAARPSAVATITPQPPEVIALQPTKHARCACGAPSGT